VSVCAGFPSPADDHLENQLDLAELVGIRSPEAVYFIRAEGDSMTEAGIHSGDTMVMASLKGPWRCLLISARSSIREAFFRAGPYRFKPNVRRTLTDAESTNNATASSFRLNFAVSIARPAGEPGAVVPHSGICEGGARQRAILLNGRNKPYESLESDQDRLR
jgi:hypothetical protein